ncbi:hypothetical protein XENOCAPTIV_003562, partial [Xenoophorus captivus]
MDCGAVLQADEGHDLCPTCLGRDHLVDALSEKPCMNCSFMPRALRVARLAQLCPQDDADLPPSGQVAPLGRSKCCACCRTLKGVPVVLGELFGSAAVEALDRTVQVRQTSQQLSGLCRSMAPPKRSSRPS